MNREEFLAALRTEIRADPRYANKSHDEIEQLIAERNRDVNNTATITGDQLFELLDPNEYLSIIDPTKRTILSDILRHGIKANSIIGRRALETVFGPTSNTVKNVDKLKKRKGARWEEIGLPTRPTVSDIADALRS